MKVVLVSTYLSRGGAAIAAVRQAEALHREGVCEVSILYLRDPEGVAAHLPFPAVPFCRTFRQRALARLYFYLERIEIFVRNGFRRKGLFHISTAQFGFDLSRHPHLKDADIVHLHWVCQGFISLPKLHNLGKLKARVVWTLHDMWSITAVAPHLSDPDQHEYIWNTAGEKSMVKRAFKYKEEAYREIQPVFVGCSRWISLQAVRSSLGRRYRIFHVPNPIDTEVYAPALSGKETTGVARILLVAASPADPRKGFGELLHALTLLCEKVEGKFPIQVDCVGGVSREVADKYAHLPIEFYGYISDPKAMIDLYRKARVYVNPSLHENLPNTIMESLSCGTPVVAFRTGGIPEMIMDGKTGAVCEYADPNALSEGIYRILTLPADQYNTMCRQCREEALRNYAYPAIALHWADIYSSILGEKE